MVGPGRRVTGVVSAADLLLKIADPDPEGDCLPERYGDRIGRRKRDAVTAWDLMTAPPVTIAAGATPQGAAGRMRRYRVKRLPWSLTAAGSSVSSAVWTC
ncbi:CBS domain-containing protein [Allosalinactinospora lopnorensis]|uniref:CBS domain-containing protein n=1 Tax=Allosalinactinospora lopnorensis TaxID=1352348 RepID=UPI001F45B2BA|nr:CBS domain-containing protein [Allosalinactinospora lopnorensis]